MKPRSAAWFVKEVKRLAKKNPGKPVRIDLRAGETYRLIFGIDGAAWYPKNGAPWRLVVWPSGKRPEPIKTALVSPPAGNDRDAWIEKAEAKRKTMQSKLGPDYHVERVSRPQRKAGASSIELRVWRGEDWRDIQTACEYPGELPQVRKDAMQRETSLEYFYPMAKKWIEGKRKWRDGGKKGAAKSVATRTAKRGDRIENHRAVFDKCFKIRRGSYLGAAKELKRLHPEITFDTRSIAQHFTKHPKPLQ